LLKRARAYSLDPSSEQVPPLLLSDFKVISMQLLRALYHLKERQVVHRDLKPGNVLYLVDTEGRISLIKLIDFGVALGIGQGALKDMHERQVVGTLGYMAPEMVFREASYPSDLYSAGAILYQLASGKLPVEFGRARNMSELKVQLRRVVQEKRIPLVQANPALAREAFLQNLADLVDRTLARDPTQRPPLDTFFEEWTEAWKAIPEDLLMRPIRYAS
jgi:serine/threonine-protein kinase